MGAAGGCIDQQYIVNELVLTIEHARFLAAAETKEDIEGDLTIHGLSWFIFGFVAILLVVFFLSFLIVQANVTWFGESQMATLIGVACGLTLRFIGKDALDAVTWIDESWPAVFVILLPPIIFDGGYNMKRKRFFSNLAPILALALLGTAISAFIVAGLLYAVVVYVTETSELTFAHCLLFGSLISATDPVAVLAVFRTKRVDADLYSLLFGESMLNDAVAIVMFETIIHYWSYDEVGAFNVAVAVGDFVLIFCASVIVGVSLGIAFTLFFKYARMQHHVMLELIMFLLLSFCPFLIAQGVGLSGIVATLFAAIIMSHYTSYNISVENQLLTRQVYEMARTLCETFMFLYLGIEFFLFDHDYRPSLIVCSLFVILAARALHVFPLLSLANLRRAPNRLITFPKQFVIFFSGLRGAIAFALAVLAHNHEPDIPDADILVTTTLVNCVITMFVFGGLIFQVLKCCGQVSEGPDVGGGVLDDNDDDEPYEPNQSRFVYFDRHYLKPFLTHRGVPNDDTLTDVSMTLTEGEDDDTLSVH